MVTSTTGANGVAVPQGTDVIRDPYNANDALTSSPFYVHILLSDGAGPVYDHPGANDLEPALRRAVAALEVRPG